MLDIYRLLNGQKVEYRKKWFYKNKNTDNTEWLYLTENRLSLYYVFNNYSPYYSIHIHRINEITRISLGADNLTIHPNKCVSTDSFLYIFVYKYLLKMKTVQSFYVLIVILNGCRLLRKCIKLLIM